MREEITDLRLREFFEPILEVNESYIVGAVFRETPNFFHYVVFHLLAALFTRNYYVVLTSKRVMVIPIFFPHPLYDYEQIAYVEYESIDIDTYSVLFRFNIQGRNRPLVLKFAFYTHKSAIEIIFSQLIQKKQERLNKSQGVEIF